MPEMARSIVGKYVLEGSENEINLDATARQQVIRDGTPSVKLLFFSFI